MNREVYALLYSDNKDKYDNINQHNSSVLFNMCALQSSSSFLDSNRQWMWLQTAQGTTGQTACESMEVDAFY